ncbi:MAG: undecaprenyl-phosphate glucose phosphotransferase [Duncaniella sp.]|nr:undecaprenyl-phosphate glucose phosphotransferase [Duncaniella sp.]
MFQRGKYGRFIHRIYTAVDIVVLNLVFFVVGLFNPDVGEFHSRMVWLLLNIAFIPAMLWVNDVNQERNLQMDSLMRRVLLVVASHLFCFITLLYLMELDNVRWHVFVQLYCALAVVLLVWRLSGQMLLKYYRSKGGNQKKVVIMGCGVTGRRLYEEMVADIGFGYEVQGFFDLYCPPDFPYKHLYKGNFSEFEAFVEAEGPDELYYAASGQDEELVQLAVRVCDSHLMKFYFVPRLSPYLTRGFKQDHIGSVLVMAGLNNPLESAVNSTLKRLFDIIFSLTFLILSPVIFIPVAIAIKLTSPGPVFFKQKRTGYKGNEFWCYKFRTMRVNDDADIVQASKNDPRKTPIGDFLRKTSIDELPQFFNVLRGDMSVVGPRPHMLKHTEDYSRLISDYMVRHFIKPGITGWAQVRGYRGQTEELWQMQKRVEHDIWYIEHWSFLLDIKIIIRTIINAFSSEENAY